MLNGNHENHTRPDSVVWNGRNEDEVLELAERSSFGFVVGSDYYKWRWWHRLANRLGIEWIPREDKKVLEIYPGRMDDEPWHWTTARVGDRIHRDGSVTHWYRNL